MTTYQPLTEVTQLPLTSRGFDVAYFPNDLSNASIQSTGNQFYINLGPYVLCKMVDAEPSAAERTASALERIAAVLEGLVSNGGNLKVERP